LASYPAYLALDESSSIYENEVFIKSGIGIVTPIVLKFFDWND